ncbi:MAG: type II secretion system protein GspM, partial [Alphaproteobacteria bacterium]
PGALAGILLPGKSPAAAAANLQQSLGLLIADSGAMLLSFELLPAANAEDIPLEPIIGRIRLTANTPSLQVVLHAMEVHRPLLALDNIFVRARSDQDTVPGGHLDIQMDVSGYRQASP